MPQTIITKEQRSFAGLGISPKILEILGKLKFTVPTPIQLKAIPVANQGQDLMGIAQTGTGKTLAFGIPMLQKIVEKGCRGLIVVPTRELAIQVEEALRPIVRFLGLRAAVIIGGASMFTQKQEISKKPHVIIATPGRLYDHLQHRSVKLDQFNIIVLDEADRMLDMGFEPQIKQILHYVAKEKQTMLFSATMPDNIVKIASSYMRTPVRIEVATQGTTVDQIEQEVYLVHQESKRDLLRTILAEHAGTVLVFSRTKHGASKLAIAVTAMGHTAGEIHSDLNLSQRRRALENFKTGRCRVLIATDIAARGIDVKNIALVINYDLPDDIENYTHRIGRTGRAGQVGKAISFATPDQRRDIYSIEEMIKKRLTIKEHASAARSSSSHSHSSRPFRGAGGGYGTPRAPQRKNLRDFPTRFGSNRPSNKR